MTPTITEKPTINSAIDNAAIEVEKTLGLDKTSEKTATTEIGKEGSETSSTGTSTDETTGSESTDLSELDINNAKELFKALRDPEKAPGIIEYLAKQSGFEKKVAAVETKKEAIEVKDDILETLKTELGDEFDFLSPRLGKALDKILAVKIAEHTKDIKETLEKGAREKTASEVSLAYGDLARAHFGKDEIPGEVQTVMSELMGKYPPSSNMTPKEYLTDMLNGAASRLGIDLKNAKATAANADRIKKNRTDAPSRLSSERAITDTSVISSNPKQALDMNAAIRQAEEAVAAKFASK